MRQERRWGLSRTHFSRFALSALAPLSCWVAGCQGLQPVDIGVCGNGVVESSHQEDCDCADSDVGTKEHPECPAPATETNPLPKAPRCGRAGVDKANLCRYVCTDDNDRQCPEGYGCGSNHVCRKATGAFEILGGAVDADAERIEVADFDGDQRDDLLAISSSTASAVFSEPSGALSGLQTFATNGVKPAIGKLTSHGPTAENASASILADTTDDLVLGVGLGTNVFRGGVGRTFSPTVYDTPLVIGEIKKALVDSGGIRFLTTVAETQIENKNGDKRVSAYAVAVVQAGDSSTYKGTVLRAVLGEAKDVSFGSAKTNSIPMDALPKLPIPTGDFDDDGRTDVVFAPLNEDAVLVHSPLKQTQDLPPPIAIKLRKDVSNKTYVAGQAFFNDIDDDGDLDVLVTASCPLPQPVKADKLEQLDCYELQGSLYDSITKNFAPEMTKVLQLAPVEPPPGQMNMPPPYMHSRPLAIVDLDGDGIVDIVDGFGISRGVAQMGMKIPASFMRTLPNTRAPFTEAAVIDANLDGHLDVFASSDFTADISFMNGDGSGIFGTSFIATRGPVSLLTTGDFDGDSVPDLAFAEWDGPSEGVGSHLLSVSFGRAFGVPEAPTRMSAFDEISSISNVAFGLTGTDIPDDLQVAFAKPDTTTDSISMNVILGTSTRQLQPPFLVLEKDDPMDSSPSLRAPRRFFAGQFDTPSAGSDNHKDVVFVGTLIPGGSNKVTFLRSSEEAQLELGKSAKFADFEITPASDQFLDGVVLNLDDGAEEILLSGGSVDTQGQLAIIGINDGTPTLAAGNIMSDPGTLSYKHMRVADVDGDGKDDILAIAYWLSEDAQCKPFAPKSGKKPRLCTAVTVFLNDGAGHLCWAPADATAETPCRARSLAGPEVFLDVDATDTDGDGKQEILAVTESGVRLFDLAELGNSLLIDEHAMTAGRELVLPIQGGWSAARRCDVNGDGVDDLALAAGGRMYVFGGVPSLR